MNQRRSIAALMTSGAALVGLFVWANQHARHSDNAVAELRRTVAGLSRELEDAEAQRLAQRQEAGASTTVIHVQKEPSPGPAQAPAGRREESAPTPPEPPSNEDQRAFVQATFATQEVDSSWSRSATAQVEGMFGQLSSKDTTIRSVECRSNLCRVELTQASEEESKRVAQAILYGGNLGWQGAISAAVDRRNADGSVAYVLYLGRGEMPVLD